MSVPETHVGTQGLVEGLDGFAGGTDFYASAVSHDESRFPA
jgi:hypothetical protein